MLAPVHAVGSPSATRSHFDAQDYMETGTPDVKGTRDGWLNRYLALQGTCEAGCAHDAQAVAVPRRGDDAADAAHARGAGADDRHELARRVQRARRRAPTRSALEALYRTGTRRRGARAPAARCSRR